MPTGFVFMSGSMLTVVLVVRLLRQAARCIATAYRRKVGWTVVALSYGIVLYVIATPFRAIMRFNDRLVTAFGLLLFSGLLAAYLCLACRSLMSSAFTQE